MTHIFAHELEEAHAEPTAATLDAATPLVCSQCGAQNRYAASFCGRCGTPVTGTPNRDAVVAHAAVATAPGPVLSTTCPTCGAQNRSAASFCGRCGASLTLQALEQADRHGAAPARTLSAMDGWVAAAILLIAAWTLVRIFTVDGSTGLLSAERAFLDAARDAVGGFPTMLWSESTGQPAGYSYVLRGWTGLFGSSSAALRTLSALLGAASLATFYVMCLIVFDRRAALFAMLMLAFSAWHVWYSGHALPVAGFLLLQLLGVAALLAGMAGTGRTRRWMLALAAIAFGASAYSHNAFFVFAAAVALLWARELLFTDGPAEGTASRARAYLAVAAVVLAPYMAALALNSGDVWSHGREIWISRLPEYQEAGGLMERSRHALGSVTAAALSLLRAGENGRLLLDPATGLLATLGLLVGLGSLGDRRHMMLWALFACAVVPGGLTVARGPDDLLFASAPAVFAYAGFAVHWLLGWMEGRAARYVQVGFVAAVFLFVVLYNLTSDYGGPATSG